MIKVEKIESVYLDNELCKVTEMGNVVEVQYMSNKNCKPNIINIGNGEYVVCSTGEIKEHTRHETRATQLGSMRRTFKHIRELINTNVIDVRNALWCTLTYADNMTDVKRLAKDFKNFILRLNRYCEKELGNKPEYIAIAEPQGRGAWHFHVLLIFSFKFPYISNNDLSRLWQQGFVRINKLQDVDNVGAYLSAYLADMPLDETETRYGDTIKIVKDGSENKKYFVKGARIPMYPANFNILRKSKGIKEPTSYTSAFNSEKVQKKISSAKLTFEKNLKLIDTDSEFCSVLSQKYYNTKRKS